MEQVKYICPHWGSEDKTASGFINSVVKEGYDGIEINLPDSSFFINEFEENLAALRKWQPDFVFIAQQVLEGKNETVEGYIKRMQQRLEFLVTLQPDFINSHTGKDYFSFDDNCRIIEATENIAVRSGIPILHETHRGRFTFHAATLLPYLDRFMGMKLVGDFSHWCNVSESMLDDQQHILKRIIPHIGHIHARVGYEHGPQVNDPFAPEWKQHLEMFTSWWKEILEYQKNNNAQRLTITPEFGPVPYMPALPFTRQPLGNQWQINSKVKDYLKTQFNS